MTAGQEKHLVCIWQQHKGMFMHLCRMNDFIVLNQAKLEVSEKAQIACNWNPDILLGDTMTKDDRALKDAMEIWVRIVWASYYNVQMPL